MKRLAHLPMIAASLALALPAAQPLAQSAGAASPARPAASVLNCAAGGNQQEIGAVLGGLAGAAIGNALSRENRTVGLVLGGALGAAAGSWVGCRLQISDQMKAQAALERALAENSAQSWRSEVGAASGTVEVVSSGMMRVADGPAAPAPAAPMASFAPGVEQMASYDTSVAGPFTARSRANIRTGASTGTAVAGQLARGEQVLVIGQVPGQPWYLIGTDTTARGYVSASLLNRAGAVRPAAAQAPMRQCRVLRETIQGVGQTPQVSTYRGCQNPGGGWTLSEA